MKILFGGVVTFLLDNFGFIIFIGLVIWVWKGLQDQQRQYTPTYGVN
jgi:hypothetical protein